MTKIRTETAKAARFRTAFAVIYRMMRLVCAAAASTAARAAAAIQDAAAKPGRVREIRPVTVAAPLIEAVAVLSVATDALPVSERVLAAAAVEA
jgi:hypothetical protein